MGSGFYLRAFQIWILTGKSRALRSVYSSLTLRDANREGAAQLKRTVVIPSDYGKYLNYINLFIIIFFL